MIVTTWPLVYLKNCITATAHFSMACALRALYRMRQLLPPLTCAPFIAHWMKRNTITVFAISSVTWKIHAWLWFLNKWACGKKLKRLLNFFFVVNSNFWLKKVLTSVQQDVSEGLLHDVSEQEQEMWRDQWIECSRRLNQWDLLCEFAKINKRADLLVQTCWKTGEWVWNNCFAR